MKIAYKIKERIEKVDFKGGDSMSLRERFFNQLLNESELRAGLRVLDVGCGSGDISFLIDDFFQHEVEIVGIDLSPQMIDIANGRKEEGQNIDFIQADLTDFNEDIGQFDLIVGRRVLMYLPQPEETLCQLTIYLKDGGKMIFEESDAMASSLNGDGFSLHNDMAELIWKTVQAESGHIHIGSQMYQLFKEVGFQIKLYKSELILHTVETGSDLGWVAEMMQDRFVDHGLIDEDWDIDEVKKGLEEELEQAKRPFIRDASFGICVQAEQK